MLNNLPLPINSWNHTDIDGNIIPWYTEPFLQYLITIDISNWNVFEWGSGYSTIWWSKKVRTIHSVDTDADWVQSVLKNVQTNATVECVDSVNFANRINDFDKFDCIIVDGAERDQCLRSLVGHVKLGGKVILDNSERFDFNTLPAILTHNTCHIFPQHDHTDWKTTIWDINYCDIPPILSHWESAQRRKQTLDNNPNLRIIKGYETVIV